MIEAVNMIITEIIKNGVPNGFIIKKKKKGLIKV